MKFSYLKMEKSLKFYKNKQLVFGDKDFLNNTIIYNFSNKLDGVETLFNSNCIFNRYFRAYYTPRLIVSPTIKHKRITIKQLDRYKDIKAKFPFIKIAKPKLELYNTFNMVYDCSPYLSYFFQYFGKYAFRKRIALYQEYIEEFLVNFSTDDSKNIFIFINPEGEISPESNNIESILYSLSYYNLLDEHFFRNIKFIFYSKKMNMIFKVENFTNKSSKMNLLRYKKFVNTLYKLDNNIELSAEEKEVYAQELEEINSDEADEKGTPITANKTDTILKSLGLDNKRLTEKQYDLVNDIDKIVDNVKSNTLSKTNSVESLNTELDKNKAFLNKVNDLKKSVTEYDNGKKNIDIVKKDLVDDEGDEEYYESDEESEEEYSDPDDVENDDILDNDELDYYLDNEKQVAKKNNNKEKNAAKLKDKQSKIVFDDGKTLDSILEDFEISKIETTEIPGDYVNTEVKKSKLKDFDKSYNTHQSKRDLALVLSSFNDDPEIPLYITDIKTTDTSDAFNKVETMEIKFEDTDNVKHNVKIKVPKVIDNSFFYINNGKKAISKQLTLLPVVKNKPDTVQITTNYSKLFLERFGQKVDPNVEKLKKFINKYADNYSKIKYKLGNNIGSNSKYINSLEYNEISNYLIELRVGNYYFNFNRDDITYLTEDALNISISLEQNEILVGYNTLSKNYYVFNMTLNELQEKDKNHQVVTTEKSIFDLIIKAMSEVDEGIPNIINKQTSPAKMMYTRTRITGEDIPLIILLGFYFGFTKTINAYKIEYKFNETKIELSEEEKDKYGVFRFADGYFYYPLYPLRNSLLVNGLCELNTRELNFSDLDNEDSYLDFFQLKYNSANKSKGFKNFLSFFLDPITIDVCKTVNLPTNLLDLILYANTLLEDSYCSKLNDISNYRIRSNELINAHLYKILADGFKHYKDETKRGRKSKIMIKEDQLIKDLVESPLVDEYSVLNPILEIEKLGSVTYRGLSGTNDDHAFISAIRSYDDSMMGCIGMNSPDSDKVGVVRQLSYSPKIINNRGILDNNMKMDDMAATDLFAPSELLSPFTATHSDPPQNL